MTDRSRDGSMGLPCWYTMDSHLVKVGSGDVWIQHWSSWFFLSQIQDEQTNNDNSTWAFLPGSQGVTWKVVEFLEFFLCLSGVLEIWDCTCAGTYFEEEASATMHFRPLDRICVKSFFFHSFFSAAILFLLPEPTAHLPVVQGMGASHDVTSQDFTPQDAICLLILGKSRLMSVRKWQIYM